MLDFAYFSTNGEAGGVGKPVPSPGGTKKGLGSTWFSKTQKTKVTYENVAHTLIRKRCPKRCFYSNGNVAHKTKGQFIRKCKTFF